MRKEAKIGLAVVLVLGGVFAFIVYKGLQPRGDAASKSRVKAPDKKKPAPAAKPGGGLLDRWNDVPAATASSSSDPSGPNATPGGAGPGAAGQAAAQLAEEGDGAQDPFAARGNALDRYANRYDQGAASERTRLSIYGDDADRNVDESGAAPAPLPATAGESVRRVSVYGPAPPPSGGEGGNPLRSDSAASDGADGAPREYDPPGGSYGFASGTDGPRDAFGRGAADRQQAVADDDNGRGATPPGQFAGQDYGRREDAYGRTSSDQGAVDAYGRSTSSGQGAADAYGRSASPGQGGAEDYGRREDDWRRGTTTSNSSSYGSTERGSNTYGSNSYGKTSHGSSGYGGNDGRSQYGSAGYSTAGGGYNNAGYGRSTAAQAQPADPVPVRRDGKYVVQPNDSCWLISRKLFGTGAYFKAIEEHNRHNYPRMDRLQVGDVLEVPTAEQLRAAYPDLCPKLRQPASRGPQGYQVSATRRTGGRVYVVQDGDNLFDIARYELGSAKRWVEIFDLNRDLLSEDFDYLPLGAELVLPGVSAESDDTLTERPGSPYSR